MSPIDQPLVKTICQRFCSLGPISAKTMFGGIGLYQAGVMFALVSEEKLYLRSGEALEALYRQHSTEHFIYTKRGRPVILRYYSIDNTLWDNQVLLLTYAQQALAGARQDKQRQAAARHQRLKDLPNLGLSSERLLHRVGIESIEQLRDVGAVRAYLRIKARSRELSLNYLWALAGALAGCHAANLPKETRHHLLVSLQDLQEERA
ncbi:TfoX/Sxy family DNA transformation protein [unidentified bacterial endosymbiont]|uniref:TfoX/Sxy family DNA transformation protein n=1 Tax=unidentified bacterial endosymbiont TaxID=2355 RepID=UPI00209E9C0F|nr:TfoX/Sxy family DNA transformation protein [unidentified bacterial endosymbiont]